MLTSALEHPQWRHPNLQPHTQNPYHSGKNFKALNLAILPRDAKPSSNLTPNLQPDQMGPMKNQQQKFKPKPKIFRNLI